MQKIGLTALLAFGLANSAMAADKTVLAEIYTQVPSQYVTPIGVEPVAVALLKGLDNVDKKLKVGNDNDKVSLYYQGKLIKSIYKPQNRNDISAWVDLSAEIMDLASENSPKASQHDFELADLAMQSAIKKFDKDSKFYPNPESMRNRRQPHKQNFGARIVEDILLIKIVAINVNTKDNILEALKEHADAKGLILDLRGSPGGNLGEAVDIADLFLDEGIIVTTRSRGGSDVVYYNAKEGEEWGGKPMVVLVDGDTASSAEVLAAALQEQARAKVVGTGTYGKGTVQNLINLSDGAVISLTSAFFYTPSGNKLNGAGVLPNYCTYEMPAAKNVDNLIALGENRPCQAQARAGEGLDIDVAIEKIRSAVD